MARMYFSLLTRDEGQWSQQFGDYDRQCVQAELDDMRRDYKLADLKIIKTGARQVDINEAVARLNGKDYL